MIYFDNAELPCKSRTKFIGKCKLLCSVLGVMGVLGTALPCGQESLFMNAGSLRCACLAWKRQNRLFSQ